MATCIFFGRTFQYLPGRAPQFLGSSYAENDGNGNFTLVISGDFAVPGHPIFEDPEPARPEYTQWGDIDNDGDIDLLVYWSIDPNEPAPGEDYFDHDGVTFYQMFENRGAAGYVDISEQIEGQEGGNALPGLGGAPVMQMVDFDADGDLDFVASRWKPGDWDVQRTLWFENDGTGHFTQIKQADWPGWQMFHFADVNGDWLPDLVYQVPGWDRGLNNHKNYVAVQLGQIKVSVERIGWDTDDRIAGGAKADRLFGRGGDDALRGNGRGDEIWGDGGNDLLLGNGGNDRLNGGADDDVLKGHGGRDILLGESGDDLLIGGGGNDQLDGGADDDILKGLGGRDSLLGGDDLLIAGAGNDRLDGGLGADMLRGQAGRDTFVFGMGFGANTIVDFRDNVDRLELSSDLWGGGLRKGAVLRTFGEMQGRDFVFDFGNGNVLVVEDITERALRNDLDIV